jgi:hypothetical protein
MKTLVAGLFVVLALGCRSTSGPETVDPEAAGVVTAIVRISGPVERWSLDTGATVEFDQNHTVRAYQNHAPAIGNLVLTGRMSRGRWVMQVGPGTLNAPPDCFAIDLDAFDRDNAIEFMIPTDEHVDVQGGWRVRIPKTATFRWKPGGSPGSDGSYPLFTRFCLSEKGQIAGQPARE